MDEKIQVGLRVLFPKLRCLPLRLWAQVTERVANIKVAYSLALNIESLLSSRLTFEFFNRLGHFLRHIILLFQSRRASPPQARDFLLATLKSHLIIRTSKGQAADGKPETHGGDEEDWRRAHLQTRTTGGAPHRRASREAGCEKWSMVNPYFPSSNAIPNMSASSTVILIR